MASVRRSKAIRLIDMRAIWAQVGSWSRVCSDLKLVVCFTMLPSILSMAHIITHITLTWRTSNPMTSVDVGAILVIAHNAINAVHRGDHRVSPLRCRCNRLMDGIVYIGVPAL